MRSFRIKKFLSRFNKDKTKVKMIIEGESLYNELIHTDDYEVRNRVKEKLVDIIANNYIQNNQELIKGLTDTIVKEFDLEGVVREGVKRRAEDIVRGAANPAMNYGTVDGVVIGNNPTRYLR